MYTLFKIQLLSGIVGRGLQFQVLKAVTTLENYNAHLLQDPVLPGIQLLPKIQLFRKKLGLKCYQ